MELCTVVIPTLDRCVTLADTLKTCTAQDDDNFEILVSNNVSSDATHDVVTDFQKRDSRVRLITPERRLGMSAHFDFALDHVGQGYMMLLGSDDGLLPGCMPRVRDHLAANPGVDAVHQGLTGGYLYPDLGIPGAGTLWLDLEPEAEQWNAGEILRQVAAGDALPWDLPYPYNFAWVRTSVLDRIVRQTGRRIHSLYPDVWLGIACAATIDTVVHVSPPFALVGISAKSNGFAAVTPHGASGVEAEFAREGDIALHPRITYVRSTPLIVLESLFTAIDLGLLPSDLPIALDKYIARAYYDLVSSPWNNEYLAEQLAALKAQSQLLGCLAVIEKAEQFPTWQEWSATLDFPLALEPRPEFSIDAGALGIANIHQATQLAQDIVSSPSRREHPVEGGHQIFEHIRAWARAAGRTAALPYEWGQVITLGGDSLLGSHPYCVLGFEDLQAERAWTVGAVAEISLQVDDEPGRDVVLELDATTYFQPPLRIEQSVRVSVNGHHVGQWQLTPDHPTVRPLTIPARMFDRTRQCLLQLEIIDPTSPQDVGHNDDPRALGLSIAAMRLSRTT